MNTYDIDEFTRARIARLEETADRLHRILCAVVRSQGGGIKIDTVHISMVGLAPCLKVYEVPEENCMVLRLLKD